MLLKLRKSALFNTDPAKRFAQQYDVALSLWLELWKRHKVLDYSINEMTEYFRIKSGKTIKRRQVKRWIFLTEVYMLTKPARDKKAEVISTELFGDLEQKVVLEVTRGMREVHTKRSNIIV